MRRRFLVGPRGCEITGVMTTPDQTTMFINVQHPGEATTAWGTPRGVSQLTSSCRPLILVNQSTEDLATTQVSKSRRTCWVTTYRRYGRAQAEAAVRAVLVVVLNVAAQDVNKVRAADDQ